MPEMHFTVRWPDQTVSDCYSPSLVIKDFLEIGRSYPLSEFVALSHQALHIASDRVKAKYGFACSSAIDQLQQIEVAARRFRDADNPQVVVENFLP